MQFLKSWAILRQNWLLKVRFGGTFELLGLNGSPGWEAASYLDFLLPPLSHSVAVITYCMEYEVGNIMRAVQFSFRLTTRYLGM